jgi:ribosome-associated protein
MAVKRKSSPAKSAPASRKVASRPKQAVRRPAATGKSGPVGKTAGTTVRKPAAAKAAPAKAPRKVAGRMRTPARASTPALRQVVLDALADMKAVDVRALDVRRLTDITDTMVVASGTSDRHVKSIADRVVQRCKEAGFRPYGMEGERDGEWVLLDLQDVVLHVMLPRVREFYALEKLWEGGAAERRA